MITTLENHLWQSTLFACVMAVLALVMRKNRAAVRHKLWLAASVKFLVPFTLLIAIGSQLDWRKAPLEVQPQLAAVEQISTPFALPPSPLLVGSVPRARRWFPAVLFGVWLCGAAANSLMWWRRWRRVVAALRAASPLALRLPIRVMTSPARLEPGVFGIRKPVLLLPEGITERLTPEQLQPILAHELWQVQRRDNLTAAIHMVVETLFWFHPLVWWIERQLVEERERACDEEVLGMAGDPQDYAEGILNVCKFYLESGLICVSGVTGANLKRRVESIMINRVACKLNLGRKLLLAGAGVFAVLVPIAVGILNVQSIQAQAAPESNLAFEVASIRPHVSGAPGSTGRTGIEQDAGRVRIENLSLSVLISISYGLKGRQQLVGPGWLNTVTFDIEGKPPAGYKREQLQYLLRNLLIDRFKLNVHHETRRSTRLLWWLPKAV